MSVLTKIKQLAHEDEVEDGVRVAIILSQQLVNGVSRSYQFQHFRLVVLHECFFHFLALVRLRHRSVTRGTSFRVIQYAHIFVLLCNLLRLVVVAGLFLVVFCVPPLLLMISIMRLHWLGNPLVQPIADLLFSELSS